MPPGAEQPLPVRVDQPSGMTLADVEVWVGKMVAAGMPPSSPVSCVESLSRLVALVGWPGGLPGSSLPPMPPKVPDLYGDAYRR